MPLAGAGWEIQAQLITASLESPVRGRIYKHTEETGCKHSALRAQERPGWGEGGDTHDTRGRVPPPQPPTPTRSPSPHARGTAASLAGSRVGTGTQWGRGGQRVCRQSWGILVVPGELGRGGGMEVWGGRRQVVSHGMGWDGDGDPTAVAVAAVGDSEDTCPSHHCSGTAVTADVRVRGTGTAGTSSRLHRLCPPAATASPPQQGWGHSGICPCSLEHHPLRDPRSSGHRLAATSRGRGRGDETAP